MRIQQLEKLIKKHKELYYQGTPEISDAAYDALEEELRKLDPENYALTLVGSAPKGANKVRHDFKMLSLDKCYEVEDLKAWLDKSEALSLFKLDGVACSLTYEKGELVLAKTRGDGVEGENITQRAHWIDEIPKHVPLKDEKIEVRGEMYCTEEDFLHLAQAMEQRGLEKPTSQRNIVAGLVSRKDCIDLCRFISFQAFDYINLKPSHALLKSEREKFTKLEELGLEVPAVQVHKDFSSVEKRIQEAQEFMAEGDYQIDGLVFVYNDLALQDELGNTSHHPRYKMAFKFKGSSKVTTITGIEWGVSRNGILTPVAKVGPVELSGATITNVTLHNFGMARQYDLKVGDRIEIIRSGEVIPKFLSVVESNPGAQFTYPRECPSCSSKLDIEDIRLVCNNQACPEKNLAGLLNYVHKIGIEDLSDKRLQEMVVKGLVSKIPDLYRLSVEELLTLDKTKEKLANKIHANIQKCKEVDFTVFLSALGISGGAFTKCEKVVLAGFNTVEKIKALTLEELDNVESFAEKSAQEFLDSLRSKHDLIDELVEVGVTFKKAQAKSHELDGLKFCITGELSMPRKAMENAIRDAGGHVLGSVSKNLDYLITNETDSTSSKFTKAKELGVKIINEQELGELLNK